MTRTLSPKDPRYPITSIIIEKSAIINYSKVINYYTFIVQKRLLKYKYKKEFLFLGITTDMYMNTPIKVICGYVHEDGFEKLVNHRIYSNDLGFNNKINNGTIIYRYSMKKSPNSMDECFFTEKN